MKGSLEQETLANNGVWEGLDIHSLLCGEAVSAT